MSTIGELIRNKRIDISLSTKELADRAGCARTFINGIERNVQFPSKQMACSILNVLEIIYVDIDPYTISVDGQVFRFKFTTHGYGGKKFISDIPIVEEKKTKLQYLEDYVAGLENRIRKLEDILITQQNDGAISYPQGDVFRIETFDIRPNNNALREVLREIKAGGGVLVIEGQKVVSTDWFVPEEQFGPQQVLCVHCGEAINLNGIWRHVLSGSACCDAIKRFDGTLAEPLNARAFSAEVVRVSRMEENPVDLSPHMD